MPEDDIQEHTQDHQPSNTTTTNLIDNIVKNVVDEYGRRGRYYSSTTFLTILSMRYNTGNILEGSLCKKIIQKWN